MTQAITADLNQKGLEIFSNGDPIYAASLLKKSYLSSDGELGILVNLGLTLMQQGRDKAAEHCYELALETRDERTKRAAHKNLGFVHLFRGEWSKGWFHHGQRFRGEAFEKNQWNGESLDGKPLLIWNDVGMGDLFQFIRYTKPLVERGEKIILAIDKSQIKLVEEYLCWPLTKVVDRNEMTPQTSNIPHVPLMNLMSILDPTTQWGREWKQRTWLKPKQEIKATHIGICWASNPLDKSMHCYKSTSPEVLLKNFEYRDRTEVLSLQTDEESAHHRLKLQPAQRNWIDTLTKLAQCKEIYSVDTAIAHLAGGSMASVQLHLAKNHDWRWKAKGQQWYKNLTIAKEYIYDK